MLRELRRESMRQRAVADPVVIARFGLDNDGGLRGRRQIHASGPLAHLEALHKGDGLELAKAALGEGAAVFPTRASYLYYGPGDFGLLHHDIPQCTVTVLTALEGSDPLICYPAFGAPKEEDLECLNDADTSSPAAFERSVAAELGAERMRAEPLTVDSESLVAILGREIAHSRYPQDQPAVVATMCYSAFSYRPPWS